MYDKQTKTYNRGKSSIKFLDNEITMKFEKGTKVTDIIENVILFSEYGQSIGKTIENNKRRTSLCPGLEYIPNLAIERRFCKKSYRSRSSGFYLQCYSLQSC